MLFNERKEIFEKAFNETFLELGRISYVEAVIYD